MALLARAGRSDMSGPGKYFGGVALSAQGGAANATPGPLHVMALPPGALRGRFSSTAVPPRAAQPSGYRSGGAWVLAQKAGELAATTTVSGLGTASVAAAGGRNGSASLAGLGNLSPTLSALLYAAASLVGASNVSPGIAGKYDLSVTLEGIGAVAPGLAAIVRGTASIAGAGAIDPPTIAGGVLGSSTLAGVGSASPVVSAVIAAAAELASQGALSAAMVARLDAAASLAGAGSVSGATSALAWLLSNVAGMGALTSSTTAKGNISAAISPFTELSPQALAAAVWNALVVEYDAIGSMGEALGTGGGGGGPTPAAIANAVWNETTTTHTASDTFGLLTQAPVYTARVSVVFDDVDGADRYVVSWLRDGVVLTSGVTSARLHVVAVADGSDLVPSTVMAEVAGLSRYRLSCSDAQRLVAGEAYLAIATATIDGATRTWDMPIGRDLVV